jgi:hypothetical protein
MTWAMHGRALRTALGVGLLSLIGLLSAQSSVAATPAVTIEATGPKPTLPAYTGSPAKVRPLTGVPLAWQDPFMSQNPGNSVHNDSWQSDNYTQWGGPLGHNPKVFSSAIGRDCITLSFDGKGRLISTCSDLQDGPALYLIDSRTLATLAFKQLPYVKPPAGTDPATNTTGGAYFYLDRHDRIVLAASNHHILVFTVDDSGAAPHFRQVVDYDPTSCLTPGDRIPSVLPDAQGRLWFVGRYHGAVGVLDPQTGKCRSVILGEEIENSFAVGKDGTYIVSDKAMYKFRAGRDLLPKQIWRMAYRNVGIQKPGQINAGSGTTPTLIGPLDHGAGTRSTLPAYVAIADNADPMDVVVYRTGDHLARGQRRTVCTVPVFAKGASADENSLISMGQSLIVENNYGYVLQKWNDVISGGAGKPPVEIGGNLALVSAPGMDRIDIAADGSGCRIVWRNNTVRTPSAVSKGDSANGLIYTFRKPKDPSGAGGWYWSALDYRTGKVVWTRRAGYGGLYNNHYSGIAIGTNPVSGKPTLYLGGVGGLMALRDR